MMQKSTPNFMATEKIRLMRYAQFVGGSSYRIEYGRKFGVLKYL